MPPIRLPIVQDPARSPSPVIGEGSLGRDGRRRRPFPADVSGRFQTRRRIVYAALIVLWASLPWISVDGHPAVFLDIEKRQFFLFGSTFNAQDVWLLFFLLSGVGFGLVYATAVVGRVWCGWACPQTVFLEGLFRPIERLIQGPRNIALRRAERGPSFDRAWRIAVMHGAYLVLAVLVAHIALAYFVSLPRMFAIVRERPSSHPEAFGWMLAVTGAAYANFAFFREQVCVVLCPYGRLQSVLLDDDSLVVGYDERRGEPRGKPSQASGDCVDCRRCVVVCPTGIDIRDGLQLDCIACTACIDACDAVMHKLGRPGGLVRYDSQRGLRGEERRILRGRLYVYTALLVVGAVVAGFAFRGRQPFEANLVRLPGTPYVRDGGTIRNAFELRISNKESHPISFVIESPAGSALAFTIPVASLEVEPLGTRRLPVFVSANESAFVADRGFHLLVHARGASGKTFEHDVEAVFLGARR